MNTRLLWIHCLSPLHAGTGQSVGAVDLAIARDRATDHPYLPGSSIKGSLADLAGARVGWAKSAFGPETSAASEHAGALAFSDANLLLLPVRSVGGTFAWATSPLLLRRYAQDAREAGIGGVPDTVEVDALGQCAIGGKSRLRVKGKVVFEDLDFEPQTASEARVSGWALHLAERLFPGDGEWQAMLEQRLCIVSDDVMTYLSRHGTDVRMRVSLDTDTKTAKTGQLWTEECLPVETVLVGLVASRPNAGVREAGTSEDELFNHVAGLLTSSVQLGGKATVGRGRCRLLLDGGSKR